MLIIMVTLKGVTDADNRANTNSTNYKTGYNQGVNDGRVGYYTKAQYDANYNSGYSAGASSISLNNVKILQANGDSSGTLPANSIGVIAQNVYGRTDVRVSCSTGPLQGGFEHAINETIDFNGIPISLYIDGKKIGDDGYYDYNKNVTGSLRLGDGSFSFSELNINDSFTVRCCNQYLAYIGNCGGKSYSSNGTVTYYYLSF